MRLDIDCWKYPVSGFLGSFFLWILFSPSQVVIKRSLNDFFLLEIMKFSTNWCHFFLNAYFEWQLQTKRKKERNRKSSPKWQKTFQILIWILFAISSLTIIKKITSKKSLRWVQTRKILIQHHLLRNLFQRIQMNPTSPRNRQEIPTQLLKVGHIYIFWAKKWIAEAGWIKKYFLR